MTVKIFGVKRATRKINKLINSMDKPSPALREVGRALRNNARMRITTQGGGAWAKLSKWTRARTGRRKAFLTERRKIKFKIIGGRTVVVGHESTGWDFDQHAKGFETPGFSGRAITIVLRNPKALHGVRGNHITIRGAKKSVVPARRVFATQAEAIKIANPILKRWVKKHVGKAKR